MKSKTAWTPY